MPEVVARNTFGAGAHYAARGGGPDQLRKNLARVLGVSPDRVPDGLMRASLASYARYWREAFRLPTMDLPEVGRQFDEVSIGTHRPQAAMDAGRGGILALPHSGNWDMAGVWLVHKHGTFLHRGRATEAGILVPPLHRIPGKPRVRGVPGVRRRAPTFRAARRAVTREQARVPDVGPRPHPVRGRSRLLRRTHAVTCRVRPNWRSPPAPI